ncbi:hypothetical protein OCU04_012938 [Sclerotinia nivalis]|uniref:Uncharacterized protein n=1 Tax=Sclerotinia nivalis TaxID=352851 RepID=A0A9X0A8B8_9HELO|nr:hypothetical protein OCU04_012938 [Sclerotinia nivalis]
MEGTSFEKGENWEIYKDAFAPQPTGKILKAWERAPVISHAPRLHGQKIWKKRGGLRAAKDNKENYNDAFLELEKEGAGSRKRARVVGNKEDISRAKWHEGKDKNGAWDENIMMGMGSPRKNVLGSPDKLQVVPRKRTNANLAITPRKPLRQMLLGGEGKGSNMGMSLSPAKDKEASGSPARRRKAARKSIRKLVMPMDDAHMDDEKKHHVRHTSLVFDFEMTTGENETESKQGFEQSPKKTPKRQSLRRSMRGRVSEPVQVLEKVLTSVHKKQSSHAGLNFAPLQIETVEDQTNAMDMDHKQDVSSENDKSQGTGLISATKSVKKQDISITTLDAATESAQTENKNLLAQKSIKNAKQKRASLRRSTRRSDPLLESRIERPLVMKDAEVTSSNNPTARIRDLEPDETSQNTGDILNSTVTPAGNLHLQELVSSDSTEETGECQEESSDVGMPSPVEEINHIVEELLDQPVSGNDNLGNVDSQESMLHSTTDTCSVELPANVHRQQAFSGFGDIQLVKESPTAHVAPLEDSDDEDMDDSMSELCEILLEPTINVANLGLSASNESSHDNTNEMQDTAVSDPIEDPESFDLMPINSLHANNQPINPEADVTPAELSVAFATTSNIDDTFSLSATSSFENDDMDILRQFLTRVKADKAAKAAAPAPKKRRSLPHSPLRIPLGDIMNAEASSPVQATKEEFDVSFPATTSPSRKSRPATPPSIDEVDLEAKSIRRSGRTRPPVPKIPLPAPSSIPVRRLGGHDGDTTVTLKQSVEKELAALTRVNTRKNKAGAVLPEILLARKADEKDNPAKRQKELKEMFEEKVRREKKAQGKTRKTVVWAEEIAQYQTLARKEKKTMASRKVSRSGERIVDENKPEEAEEAKEKWVRVKIPTGSSSRTSKIAVGIPTANGTPAKKKRLIRS